MKYFVIGTKWDSNTKTQVKFIIGEFDRYIHAQLFKETYDTHYKTETEIIEILSLLKD